MIKRVLLKISGEALLCKDGKPIDQNFLAYLSAEMKNIYDQGVEIAIVVGGGNIFRGLNANRDTGLDRVTGDYMGMLGTVINSLALKTAFEANGMPSRAMTAIEIPKVAEPFIRGRAIRHLEKKRIVIFGAGTGNPYFTTDSAGVLRALEIDADLIIKATKVDGVYDKDPVLHEDAVRYDKLTYEEVLIKNLQVMDATGIALAKDDNKPILVLNMKTKDNIRKAVSGESVGTTISV